MPDALAPDVLNTEERFATFNRKRQRGTFMSGTATLSTPYSVQHIVDHEHKHIHLKLDKLKAAIIKGKGLPSIFEAADALIRKTQEHFQEEEKIMAVAGYRDLPKHLLAHAILLKEIQEIKVGLMQRQISSALQLSKFFSSSILDHFREEDIKFEEAIRTAVNTGKLRKPNRRQK
jgi:hemerythrin-like metal-binding protein